MNNNHYPYFIDWVLTDRCNLRCRHCRGMSRGELSRERAEALIKEIVALKPAWVILEGGEPLLKEDLITLIGLLKQHHLKTYLITNGLLLTPEKIALLKKLDVRIMLSIDGAHQKTYESIRQGSDFYKVVAAAKACARQGILEALNFTILKSNQAEIADIIHLAQSIGAPKINFIGLKPCHNYRDELLTSAEYKEAIKTVCRVAHETGIEFFFDEPFFWAAVKEWELAVKSPIGNAGIVAPSDTACAFGEYLFIEPDGTVKPCSFAQLPVGNVNSKPLTEIWQDMLSSPLINKIKDCKNRTGQCATCSHLESCKGCRSRTFAITGGWLASDLACPLAIKSNEEGHLK
ncbi:MAG: radical SAM protein [Candidatus Omnitrophota bacterium]